MSETKVRKVSQTISTDDDGQDLVSLAGSIGMNVMRAMSGLVFHDRNTRLSMTVTMDGPTIVVRDDFVGGCGPGCSARYVIEFTIPPEAPEPEPAGEGI